jgi:DNA-binding MarR family transcriptional regulator
MPADDMVAKVLLSARAEGPKALIAALDSGPRRGRQAASVLKKTEQWAGQLLAGWRDAGIVVSEPDPSDRRARLWSLSPHAKQAVKEVNSFLSGSRHGWIVAVRLGASGKRVLARSLLEELGPAVLYRVIGDLDFVAVGKSPHSHDLIADLRRRLHEAANVEASHVGHMV